MTQPRQRVVKALAVTRSSSESRRPEDVAIAAGLCARAREAFMDFPRTGGLS